jgi:hypothetical protein
MAAIDSWLTFKPWNFLKPWRNVMVQADVKSDTVELPYVSRAITVGTAGTVKVTLADGTVVTFVSGELAVGVVYPMAIKQLWDTGTAATNVKLWY